jgi:hypothetical protein
MEHDARFGELTDKRNGKLSEKAGKKVGETISKGREIGVYKAIEILGDLGMAGRYILKRVGDARGFEGDGLKLADALGGKKAVNMTIRKEGINRFIFGSIINKIENIDERFIFGKMGVRGNVFRGHFILLSFHRGKRERRRGGIYWLVRR